MRWSNNLRLTRAECSSPSARITTLSNGQEPTEAVLCKKAVCFVVSGPPIVHVPPLEAKRCYIHSTNAASKRRPTETRKTASTLIRCVGNHVDQSPFREPKCGPNAGRTSRGLTGTSPEVRPTFDLRLPCPPKREDLAWDPGFVLEVLNRAIPDLACTPAHSQVNGRANEALTPAIAIEATSTLLLVGSTRKLGGPMNRCQGLVRQPASQALLVSCQSGVFPRHTHPCAAPTTAEMPGLNRSTTPPTPLSFPLFSPSPPHHTTKGSQSCCWSYLMSFSLG